METKEEKLVHRDVVEQLERFRQQALNERLEREKRIKEHWENLPKFNKPEDVPTLPRVDEKEWKEFYIPKLIGAGAIPKKNLIDGQIYIGEHRAGRIAKWNEKENRFYYKRQKFYYTFYDICNHFEDDDGFALFVPIRTANDDEVNEYNDMK